MDDLDELLKSLEDELNGIDLDDLDGLGDELEEILKDFGEL